MFSAMSTAKWGGVKLRDVLEEWYVIASSYKVSTETYLQIHVSRLESSLLFLYDLKSDVVESM